MAQSVSIGNSQRTDPPLFSVHLSLETQLPGKGTWGQPPRPPSMSVNVLIVEDDLAMARMCAKLIRRKGYTVVVAGSGEDALAIICSGKDIDVVISDVQMAEMTGVQLLAQLRAMGTTFPIILMTGYAHLLSPSQALALGAAECLTKPFDSETLINSLERVVVGRLGA